jgi:DNA-binding transcriptional ArsR family regulator
MSKGKADRILSEAELTSVARHFRLLGDPMRLKILQSVCQQPRSVSDIVAATGATQPNISKHLALLASAGIVTRERNGKTISYGLRDQLTLRLCKLVRERYKR